MAAPFVVACTHCEAKLKLKDESFAGKKLRCPKCQQAFVVPGGVSAAPGAAAAKKRAKPKDDFDFGGLSEDDYEAPPSADGEGDDFDDLPKSPVAKRKATAKSSGKKKAKKRASSGDGFGRIALIGAAVLLGIGLVGGVGYGIYAIVAGMGGGADRLAWLPEDTDVVIEANVREAWNSGVLEPLRGGEIGKAIADRMKGEAELDPNDIDRVVVGVSLNSQTPVVVVYANKPINQADVKEGATTSTYGGFDLYSKGGDAAMFFPNAETLVGGPEAKLKAAIDRQGVCPVADQFGHMPTRGTIVLAANKFVKPNGQSPAMFTTSGVDPEKLKSMSLTISMASDIDVEFSCVCPDAATAEQMVQAFEKDKADGVKQLEEQKIQMDANPLLKMTPMRPLVSGAEQALESYQVSSSGTTVTGGITVPGKLLKDAAEAMGPMMSMMMQQLPGGGIGGGGGFGGGDFSPGEFSSGDGEAFTPPSAAIPGPEGQYSPPAPPSSGDAHGDSAGSAHGESSSNRPTAPAGSAHGDPPANQPTAPAGAAHGDPPANRPTAPAGGAHGEPPANQPTAPAGAAHGEPPANRPNAPAGGAHGEPPANRPTAPAGGAHGEPPANRPTAPAGGAHGEPPANRPSAPAVGAHGEPPANQPMAPAGGAHGEPPANRPAAPAGGAHGEPPANRPKAPAGAAHGEPPANPPAAPAASAHGEGK